MWDGRLASYFVLTTLNLLLDAAFEEQHLLTYSMVVWRLLVLAWWAYHHKSNHERNPSRLEKAMVAVPLFSTAVYFVGIKAPHIWESNLWSSIIDTFVALYVLLSSSTLSTTSSDCCSRTVLQMFASFYTASGFWKINTHFLDPSSSCATIFLAQLLTYYGSSIGLTNETIVSVAQSLQPWFPLFTICIELSMGVSLVVADVFFAVRSRQRHVAILVAVSIDLAFHFMVCATPRPHDISGFALQCACRLALVVPVAEAWQAVGSFVKRYANFLVVLAAVSVSQGISQSFTFNNWSFLLFVWVSPFVLSALVKSVGLATTGIKTVASRLSFPQPLWMNLASFIAFFYSFGTIMLGLMEEASPNMFSNLKIHGGSNHILLPTGLLFHWAEVAAKRKQHDDNSSFLVRHWGGGEIRLESTTSAWLTEIYPNDMTHVLEPHETVVELLQSHLDAGFPSVYFNSGVNRVLHVRERGWIPAPPHGQFLSYTVPALEWKRLLREAFAYEPSFDVTYVHLPGTVGDETWRATGWERRVRLTVLNGEVHTCTVQWKNEHRAADLAVDETSTSEYLPCGETELPFHVSSVPAWLSKLSMFHGYPILFHENGLPRRSIACFGP